MSELVHAEGRGRRRWPWIVGAIAVVLLVPIAIIVLPIITHQNQGISVQDTTGSGWPLEVTAVGDDGRTRTLSVQSETAGETVDTSALSEGMHLVVTGSGYDAAQGIYVAVCVIPDDPATKPGPCLGGVPTQEQQDVEAGTVQFAPSNWINNDWAWRLFGARSYDDQDSGTFTAYLELPSPAGEAIDCTETPCGIYTRNDHTALRDRVQDVYIPVGFATAD